MRGSKNPMHFRLFIDFLASITVFLNGAEI
jgi:hypothetical protein